MYEIVYIYSSRFDSNLFPNYTQFLLRNVLNEIINSSQRFTAMSSIKNVLFWLLANSLGGFNRGRIIKELFKKPQNANELSSNLNLEYKTVRYHLKVLEENSLITSAGGGYGKTYFPSDELQIQKSIFDEIWDEIGKKTD